LDKIDTGAFVNDTHIALGQEIVTSKDGNSWVKRVESKDTGFYGNERFSGVAYGKGTYVAVGTADGDDRKKPALITSKDKVTWKRQVVQTSASLESVVFGKNIFVGVGNEGVVVTSLDGVKWKEHSIDKSINLKKVVYAKGMFVAVGDNRKRLPTIRKEGSITVGNSIEGDGVIFTSKDGYRWNKAYLNKGLDLRSIVFGNNEFIAVGDRGSILSSSDGIDWKFMDLATRQHFYDTLSDVAYGERHFIALGDFGKSLLISSNGADWVKTTINGNGVDNIFGIYYGKDGFYIVGYGQILTSK